MDRPQDTTTPNSDSKKSGTWDRQIDIDFFDI